MDLRSEIKELYFKWLYELVFRNRLDIEDDFSHEKLLRHLHDIPFYSIMERDENRIADGMSLRSEFGYQKGYTDEEIIVYLDDVPCSVLEVMVALAVRCEKQFMSDITYGDRTGQWFMAMLGSLRIGSMYNVNYNEKYVDNVVQKLLDRQYEYDGDGGLFHLRHPERDMRTIEIWAQMCDYLNEIA